MAHTVIIQIWKSTCREKEEYAILQNTNYREKVIHCYDKQEVISEWIQ